MSEYPTLSAEVTSSLTSLWTRYAGKRPSNGRTEIRGNVVTCQLTDAVGDLDRRISRDSVRGVRSPTLADYKREAVAAVVGVTQQRVTSYFSSHDRDSDVATEIFTLEPSLGKGRPRSLADGSG
jgi:uncharacterized protein YbcI